MIKLELTTWECMQLLNLVGQQRGNVGRLKQWFRILDQLELSDDHKQCVGWREWQEPKVCPHCLGPLQHGTRTQFAWDDTELVASLSFEPEDFKLLQELALQWPDWQATRPVQNLLEKLEAVT